MFSGLNMPIIYGLLAIILVLTGESAVWAFMERIAVENGLGSAMGVRAVFFSLMAGAVGSALAAIIAARFGRLTPMTIATILSLFSLVVFAAFGGSVAFIIAAMIYGAAWNFGAAYRMGLVASSDQSGKWTTLIPAFQMLGAIIGPIIAGQIAAKAGFRVVFLFSGAVWILAFIAFVLAIRAAKTVSSHDPKPTVSYSSG